MKISALFKKCACGAAVAAALLTPSVWSSFAHDQEIKAGFRKELYRDSSSRILTVKTDGVTRQGMLAQGAALKDITLGFYNHPSNAFLVAASPQAACWYTNLQVVDGQENLPFWQKIFGGAEYERTFANPAFSGLSYSCAPVPNKSPQSFVVR